MGRTSTRKMFLLMLLRILWKHADEEHIQLNMMISSDMRNSYVLRRAADAPGSVRIGLMG